MREDFGKTPDGSPADRYTLEADGLRGRILTYGCTVYRFTVAE